jgi:tRNA threonylcarbamoyladenosine modification (KEOPS) complex Cgi121 subunit
VELAPATFAQVKQARGGRMVLIEDDVLDVVGQLRQIDRSLRVRFAEEGGYFVVYQQTDDGEQLVLTCQELDQRVVERVRLIGSSAYDLVADMEAADAKRESDHEASVKEQVGEIGERLFHAMRKDKGATDRAFIGGN